MKKVLTIACSAFAFALVLLSSGCATKNVYCSAVFTQPAKSIPAEDLAKLNTLKIQMSSNFSSNIPSLVGGQDATFANGVIQEKLIAALYKEGYYRVTDVIWGDEAGAAKAYKNAYVEGSAHGYTSFITESFPKAALLKVSFTANVTATEKTKEESYRLTKMPYEVKTNDSGVPFSIPRPDQATYREATAPHDILDVSGNGELSFELFDADGNSVLQKAYHVSYSCGEDSAFPTNTTIVENMTKAAILEFVSEISPVKVHKDVPVNMGGNKEAIYLLGAGAYSEAIEYLEKLPADKVKPADYENLGIAFEVVGNLIDAKANYEKAGCQAGLKRIEELKSAKKELKKVDKTNDDTSFKADK